ncbi:MAG TPA: HAMP domain-containing sensor histidine kinase [Planctomycetota bacterium]|nr:HAMP domain-containing sensor histidine kinase [Planctomycetota bacterium]
MPRSPSSILFALILGLSFALVVWWTIFQIHASGDLEAVSARLADGDIVAAANALGASDAAGLQHLARARFWMFASEGTVFACILLASGWLYVASVRREASLRLAQDRFLAGATHELKTPLATIVLLLESLRDDRLPTEKRMRYLTTGLLEAERLERGLNNVLTAAGLRTAKTIPRPQLGDLAKDVRLAVEAMAARALAAEIDLRAAAPDTMPIVRDGAAMQLVLRNLLDNAVKFSAPGSAVHVTLAEHAGTARIQVRDAGRGMDPDELAHAFAPFWRGTDSATGGTGLGLHLVRELTLAQGGTVQAHSEGRGKGSEFTVCLPLRGQA